MPKNFFALFSGLSRPPRSSTLLNMTGRAKARQNDFGCTINPVSGFAFPLKSIYKIYYRIYIENIWWIHVKSDYSNEFD